MIEVQKAANKVVEDYREEKITREEYLERKVELEEKASGFKEMMKVLEDSLVNGLDLQVKEATGLEIMRKCLKVEKLTKELVDAVVEKVVVGKGKVVEVTLEI